MTTNMTPDKRVWCGCGNRRDKHPNSSNGYCDMPSGEKYPDIQGGAGGDMTPDKVELDKVIEAIGIATYGGQSFEPTGMYREKLTDILTQYHQDLMSEVVEKLEGMKIKNNKKMYDGNDVKSACDAYNRAFLEWGEVIRYEDGHDTALTEAQTIIKSLKT